MARSSIEPRTSDLRVRSPPTALRGPANVNVLAGKLWSDQKTVPNMMRMTLDLSIQFVSKNLCLSLVYASFDVFFPNLDLFVCSRKFF